MIQNHHYHHPHHRHHHYHHQDFIICKNGQSSKMLIEVILQKRIVSNFILALLEHMKPRIFFVSQPWWLVEGATHFQNLWIHPCIKPTFYKRFLYSV